MDERPERIKSGRIQLLEKYVEILVAQLSAEEKSYFLSIFLFGDILLISAFYSHSPFPSKFIPPSQRQPSKSLLKQTDHREFEKTIAITQDLRFKSLP